MGGARASMVGLKDESTLKSRFRKPLHTQELTLDSLTRPVR